MKNKPARVWTECQKKKTPPEKTIPEFILFRENKIRK